MKYDLKLFIKSKRNNMRKILVKKVRKKIFYKIMLTNFASIFSFSKFCIFY